MHGLTNILMNRQLIIKYSESNPRGMLFWHVAEIVESQGGLRCLECGKHRRYIDRFTDVIFEMQGLGLCAIGENNNG
jgi:hypothetical protein